MKRVIWAVIALGIGAGIVFAVLGRGLPVEIGTPTVTTVREYIAEDGKTRLAHEYTIDMPISGTVERLQLEVGDVVNEGDLIAKIDPYDLQQRIRETEALIAQMEARVVGVDVAKPKSEDIASAEIQIQEMRDSLEIARKTKAVVEHNFDEAERAKARAKALHKDDVVSVSFLDQAETRFKALAEELIRAKLQEEAARKQVKIAELAHQRLVGSVDDNEYMREEYAAQIEAFMAQLALLNNDVSKAKVHSPVSGPVLEKYIENRRVLAAGTPLIRIGDMNSIEIECDVLSEEISDVETGQLVEISGKALRNKMIHGTVSRIYPSGFKKISALGVEQQRIKAIIQFDGQKTALRPGTRVDLKIITQESTDALAVPDRSVFRREGQWYVFTVDGGKAHLVAVEVGLRNEEWAEILSGITAESQIILEPKNELEDGAAVKRLAAE